MQSTVCCTILDHYRSEFIILITAKFIYSVIHHNIQLISLLNFSQLKINVYSHTDQTRAYLNCPEAEKGTGP